MVPAAGHLQAEGVQSHVVVDHDKDVVCHVDCNTKVRASGRSENIIYALDVQLLQWTRDQRSSALLECTLPRTDPCCLEILHSFVYCYSRAMHRKGLAALPLLYLNSHTAMISVGIFRSFPPPTSGIEYKNQQNMKRDMTSKLRRHELAKCRSKTMMMHDEAPGAPR